MLSSFIHLGGPSESTFHSLILSKLRTERRKENTMVHAWFNSVTGDGKQVAGSLATLNMEAVKQMGFNYLTSRTHFCIHPKRIRGKYTFGTAEAFLEYSDHSNMRYQLDIKFTKKEDAIELEGLIMSGKIWPAVCYEDQQVPAPCRHLKDIWREAIGIIRRELARKLHFA